MGRSRVYVFLCKIGREGRGVLVFFGMAREGGRKKFGGGAKNFRLRSNTKNMEYQPNWNHIFKQKGLGIVY